MIKHNARTILFAVGLAVASISAGCAGIFDKCVAPELKNAEHAAPKVLGEEVATFLLCDPTFNAGAIPPCALQGLELLGEALGPGGTETINCIVTYWQTNGSPQLQTRARSVGVARGIRSSSLSCGSPPMLAKLKASGVTVSR